VSYFIRINLFYKRDVSSVVYKRPSKFQVADDCPVQGSPIGRCALYVQGKGGATGKFSPKGLFASMGFNPTRIIDV
jgi:hypothetical protein